MVPSDFYEYIINYVGSQISEAVVGAWEKD